MAPRTDPDDNDNTPAAIDATPAIVDPDDEWADVGDGDLTGDMTSRLPFIAANRKVGQKDSGFLNSDTGELTMSLDCYWLAASYSRAQYDEPFNPKAEDQSPACRSFDGHTSDPRSPARKATDCATCTYNRFDGDHVTRCHLSMEAMIFVADGDTGGGRLMKVRWGGLAFAPARGYWRSFKTRLPKRPAMAFLTRITLEPTSTDNGDFLVPRFERVREIPRAMAQPLIVERDRYMEAWKLDIADQVLRGAPDAGATDDDGAPEPFPEYDKPYGGQDLVEKLTGNTYAEGEEPF